MSCHLIWLAEASIKKTQVWIYTGMLVRNWDTLLQAQRKKNSSIWNLWHLIGLSSLSAFYQSTQKDRPYFLGGDYWESHWKMWGRWFKVLIIFLLWLTAPPVEQKCFWMALFLLELKREVEYFNLPFSKHRFMKIFGNSC